MKTKFSRLGWAVMIAGFVVAGLEDNCAFGQTYTYTFDSAVPQLNGSTITIDGTGNNGVAAFDFDGHTTYNRIVFEDITSYGPSDWTGEFDVAFGSGTYPFAEADGSQSDPSLGDILVLDVSADIVYHATNGWSGATVPDETDTIPLLLGAFLTLVAMARRLRRNG
jgi:hypothetical protein